MVGVAGPGGIRFGPTPKDKYYFWRNDHRSFSTDGRQNHWARTCHRDSRRGRKRRTARRRAVLTLRATNSRRTQRWPSSLVRDNLHQIRGAFGPISGAKRWSVTHSRDRRATELTAPDSLR